jgi:hypothetical protein
VHHVVEEKQADGALRLLAADTRLEPRHAYDPPRAGSIKTLSHCLSIVNSFILKALLRKLKRMMLFFR